MKKLNVMFWVILLLTLATSLQAQTSVERAKKLWEAKRLNEAKAILSAVNDQSKDYAAAQYYLGRIAFDENKFEDAVGFLEEAVDANDKVAEYYQWLGDAYGETANSVNAFKQIMMAKKLKIVWENALTLNTDLVDVKMKLCQFYTNAPGFLGGDIEKAKELAKQLIKQKPDEGHRRMGDILLKEDKTAEAEKEYLEMVKLNPQRTSVLARYYSNQKQWEKAFALCEEAVKRNPDDYSSIYQIGRISALSGQKMDRGEEWLRKYLKYQPKENEPSHSDANLCLAQIFEKRGNETEAKKLYELALKLDPEQSEAKDGLERVSK